MTRIEALAEVAKETARGNTARILRILSLQIDPIKEGDNGWDVEVTWKDED